MFDSEKEIPIILTFITQSSMSLANTDDGQILMQNLDVSTYNENYTYFMVFL